MTWNSGDDDNIEPVIISGDITDYTITGLNEGSTYSITVTPINDAGRGESLTFTISTTSGNIVIHTLSVCVCYYNYHIHCRYILIQLFCSNHWRNYRSYTNHCHYCYHCDNNNCNDIKESSSWQCSH